MKTKFIIAALAFAAAVPALAGTIVTAAQGKTSAIASESVKQKNTLTAPAGGLLNTDVTPRQARAVTKDTNTKIRHGKIATPDPAR